MKKRSRHSWVKPRIRGWSGITSHSPQAASGGAVATKSSIATESLDLPRPLPWAIRWLYTLLASILIFSRVVVLPKWVPDILLDSSFASALTYFRSHGIQFGKDAIYTFGPLGHLITGIYTGHVWRVQFAGGFALAAFMALLFSVTASRLPRLGGLLLVVATLLAGTNDAIYLATPAIAYLFVFSARRQEHIPLVLIGAGMALVSLLKFSFFPVAICTIVAVVVLLWRRKNRVLAAIFGSAYLAAYTTLWAVFGGGWRAFLYYIRGSLEVSAGYAQTMYLAPKPEQLYFGLGCAALCTLIVGLPFVFGANILSKSNALIWAATLFLSWKHSFLRGDSSHLLTFFCFLPFFIAGTLVIRQSKQLQVVARISGAALLFLAIIAHSRIDPELFVHMRPAVFCAETWQDLRVALQVNVKIRQLREALASQAQLYDLGDWKTIVGSNPLDVYGQAQSLAILNGFNYRPRPAFQSFESSTAYLMRRNYEYYLTSPPPFVLYGNETIDGRYPAQDDSLAQAWILTNYVPVGTKFDHLLLRRVGNIDFERELKAIGEREANVGQTVDIPDAGGKPIWCTIRLQTTMASNLRGILYQPEDVGIKFEDAAGRPFEYRFLRRPGEVGFVVSPLLNSLNAVGEYLCGVGVDRTRRLRIEPGGGVERVFLRFYTMALRQDASGNSSCLSITYPMLGVLPRAIDGFHKPVEVAGRVRLLAHAPANVHLRVPEAVDWVAGEYGFMQGAYENGGRTDGVIFRVMADSGNGKFTTLWESWLRPVSYPDDRGIHSFRIKLPRDAKDLVLQTDIGPNGNGNWDWSVWSDVKFGSVDGRRTP